MNIGAVLVLEAATDLDFSTVRSILEARLTRVRRLRQRLVETPLGCGRPVWVDHSGFDLDRHLSEAALATSPGAPVNPVDSDELVLGIAAEMVCTALDRDQPLWAARWVTGLAHDRAALVMVMHHVMTDGVGGLAVLAALADASGGPVTDSFPQPPPRLRSLAAAVWRERAVAIARVPGWLRLLSQGLGELNLGARWPSLVARTSLNRPTGPRRRLTTVELPLDQVLDVAHRRGCTVNDLVVVAVTGAIAAVLRLRGEAPRELVVSMPISARRTSAPHELGNQTGIVPLPVPMLVDRDIRLRRVASMSSARRSTSRGASAAPMGLVFRALGALGVFQVFIGHQRLVNTFVTNVRGPQNVVQLAEHTIVAVIPVAVTPGNVGVCFDVLSYAGQLVVTVVADPDIVPEQGLLTSLLTDEFTNLIAGTTAN